MRGTEEGNEPCGGKSIVLFGDLLQLPAVAKCGHQKNVYLHILFQKFMLMELEENERARLCPVMTEIAHAARFGHQSSRWNEELWGKLEEKRCPHAPGGDGCSCAIPLKGVAFVGLRKSVHDINVEIMAAEATRRGNDTITKDFFALVDLCIFSEFPPKTI